MTTTFAVPTLRPAGLVDAIRSEWTKLRSVRSTFWTLLAATVLTIGLGALISNGFAGNYSSSSPSDQATFDPTNISLTGLILGQLAIGVLGVLTVTSEYSTGMIRTSLAAVPRRGRLLVAKAGVFAAVSLVVGEVVSFLAFFLGQSIMSGRAPHATLSQPFVLRAVFGAGLYLAVLGLLAIGIGTILRHSAGAITILVAVAFVLPALSNALPSSWRHPVQKYLPTNAGSQIFAVHHGTHDLTAWAGFLVFCVYTAVVLAVGCWLLLRRDA
jgi:ABC-type transport system involved in multi-copper enzyme maturation permease subunit